MSGAVSGDFPSNSCQIFAVDLMFCVAGAQCGFPPLVRWCFSLLRCWRAFFSAHADLFALRKLPFARPPAQFLRFSMWFLSSLMSAESQAVKKIERTKRLD